VYSRKKKTVVEAINKSNLKYVFKLNNLFIIIRQIKKVIKKSYALFCKIYHFF